MKKEKPFPDNPYSQRNLIKYFLAYQKRMKTLKGT